MQKADENVFFVGGGLGGLSPAVEPSRAEFVHLKVRVSGKRTPYQRDRAWSYWSRQPHPCTPQSLSRSIARASAQARNQQASSTHPRQASA